MQTIINELISAIIQVGLFTLIPFIFYLTRKEKAISFFTFIGLSKPSNKSILYSIAVSLFFLVSGIGLAFIDEEIKQLLLSPPSVTGQLREMGLSPTTVVVLLIIALLKTSFAEEVFFRGFIAKQLIKKLDFATGNLLQAGLFGILHLVLIWALTNASALPLAFILAFSTAAGWVIGYIKEKYAKGSIVPGWVAHGLGNTVSYFVIAFLL